jgi:hypothetical protein
MASELNFKTFCFTVQDGITVPGFDETVHGAVLVLLADTPAAHQLGGFKVSPGGALRKCRDCNATLDLINTKV